VNLFLPSALVAEAKAPRGPGAVDVEPGHQQRRRKSIVATLEHQRDEIVAALDFLLQAC
jgi:hypothetical protein